MKNSDLIQILNDSKELLAKSTDPQMEPAVNLLLYRLHTPQSYIALVGETSSGKSTLINSFLERRLLPAEAQPTTGTVVCVKYGLKDAEEYIAVNRDATVEDLDLPRFQYFAKHPDPDLLRMETDQPGKNARFTGLTLFDTPGFNSIISEHEEVLREFLPSCDVAVFTVLYRTGFTMLNQHLMSMIGDLSAITHVPVLLVINRVPDGVGMTDKRIKEIRSHAEDTLHRKIDCILVPAALPDSQGIAALPDTANLWNEVTKIAFSEERSIEIRKRAQDVIRNLIQQRLNEIDGKLLSAESADSKKSLPYFGKVKREMLDNQLKSYMIIDRTFERLRKELPRFLEQAKKNIVQAVKDALENQSDWTDGPTAQAFVVGHVIPFTAYQSIKEIEHYLQVEMERLDQELSEMANTVFQHINDDIQSIENPEIKKLLENLLLRLSTQSLQKTANGLLGILGGACGSAAGIGNLAKMIVKNIGKLFNTTFSRGVYIAIGKFFTKKMVQALGVALQVIIEGIDYVVDAKTWKGKLIRKTEKAVEDWGVMVHEQFFEDKFEDKKLKPCILNTMKKENRKNVKEVYDSLLKSVDEMADNVTADYSESDIASLRQDRDKLQSNLNKLEAIVL